MEGAIRRRFARVDAFSPKRVHAIRDVLFTVQAHEAWLDKGIALKHRLAEHQHAVRRGEEHAVRRQAHERKGRWLCVLHRLVRRDDHGLRRLKNIPQGRNARPERAASRRVEVHAQELL